MSSLAEIEWATCLVRNGDREEYLPFPTAIRHKLDRRFTIDRFVVEIDDDDQWYVGIEATRTYTGEPYYWTALDTSFYNAQVNLLRWISGWWFEDDQW